MPNVLSQKAVLASVVLRGWTGRKLDRQVTIETNERYEAAADAARVNKLLISKKAFAEIHGVSNHARQVHYELTQPWLNNGARILPAALLDKFTHEFRDLRHKHEDALDAFIRDYPNEVRLARHSDTAKNGRLGRMFKSEDYPDVKQLRQLFVFQVIISPCPDVEDFRVTMAKEQLEDFQIQMKQALEDAMKEPFKRVSQVVGRMAERLKNYKPATEEDRAENTFRDSLVGNVRELVELLPAFNLTGDKTLSGMIARMEKELTKHEADVLREDEDIRKKVAKSAEAILKQAEALMA